MHIRTKVSRFGWWWVSAVHDPPEPYRSSFRSAVDSVQHDPQVQALLQTWCAESTGVIPAYEPGHGRSLHLAAPASRLEELAWRTHLDEALVTSLSSEVLGHDDRSCRPSSGLGTCRRSPACCTASVRPAPTPSRAFSGTCCWPRTSCSRCFPRSRASSYRRRTSAARCWAAWRPGLRSSAMPPTPTRPRSSTPCRSWPSEPRSAPWVCWPSARRRHQPGSEPQLVAGLLRSSRSRWGTTV